MVNCLLEDKTSHMHIEWCFKIIKMHPNGSANSLETQVLQTNIEIMRPSMHHHIWHLMHQVPRPIEHITHVGILGVDVWIVEICLAQFDCNNKITYKALPKVGEYNQLIGLFKHGHNTWNSQHYSKLQSNSKLWATWLIVLASWCIFTK
jgi:hypothetical protein